jgi:hypothetical protein
MMAGIEASWTRLEEAVLAPLRDKQVMDAFASSLTSVAEALTDPTFTAAVQTIMLDSASFVANYGDDLVNMVINLLQVLVQMSPTTTDLAKTAVDLLGVLSQIPAPVWEMVAVLYAMNKIMPQSVWKMIEWADTLGVVDLRQKAVAESSRNMKLAALGYVAGMALMMSSDEDWAKGAGALIAIASAVAAAWWGVAIAKAAGTGVWAAVATGAAGVVAATAMSYGALSSDSASMESARATDISTTTGTGNTDQAGNVTYVIDQSQTTNYEAPYDTLTDDAKAYQG